MTRERWRPVEGTSIYNLDALTPGMLLALDSPAYRHKPWRIHEIRGWRDDRLHLVIRPDGPLYDFAQHNQTISIRKHPAGVTTLPEHYALCHHCGELNPCNEVWSERVAAEQAKLAARYEIEGVCPSCQEPVTDRQASHRFEENLRVPLGPPVTFHARHRCISSAIQYDRDVAAATGREPRLYCDGTLTRHLDGHAQCTNATCPSLTVRHRVTALCFSFREACNRPECWAATPPEIRALTDPRPPDG